MRRVFALFTLGSERPIQRLVTYYLILAVVAWPLIYLFPVVDRALGGDAIDARAAGSETLAEGSQVLQDGLNTNTVRGIDSELSPRVELTLSTLIILIAVLALMLPVSWVYMSTRYNKSHDQQVAQILIFLPLVVAGIVLVVQHSLALAFSLAGVVAAVRFRSTLRDSRDLVFILLAIAVGFAAGVQALILAAIVSVLFNVVLVLTWRYDFGRNMLEPTAAARFNEPLHELALGPKKNGHVRDRDLVIALDQKEALALAERFDRVHKLVGPPGKKPRYNGVLLVTTENVAEGQKAVEQALEEVTRRWRLDEVITNIGKPSELSYLVRIRKSVTREDVLTAIHNHAADKITGADIQLAEDTRVTTAEAKA
ncbi:MAG TPA: DUF4956 domain-containing protein [Candidatus Krumholzibacteria bacterium]